MIVGYLGRDPLALCAAPKLLDSMSTKCEQRVRQFTTRDREEDYITAGIMMEGQARLPIFPAYLPAQNRLSCVYASEVVLKEECPPDIFYFNTPVGFF